MTGVQTCALPIYEDAERVHHPHDDAIVITLLIVDYTTRKVLVENGSSTNILYYPAFQQTRLGRDQLRLVNSPLVGFGGMEVQPVGTITLPMVVGAYPQQITKEVNFLVVDYSSSYNTIIGRLYPQQITKEVNFLVVDCLSSYNTIIERLTLNSWKEVTSTYHLSIKFLIEYGIRQV